MSDLQPLISDGLGAAIITTVAATGTGVITFMKWAVGQWLTDRKEDRGERAKDREVQVELQLSVAALVERDRIREERRRRESVQVSTPRVPQREFEREEITDVTIIKDRLREASRKTPIGGIRRTTPNEDR